MTTVIQIPTDVSILKSTKAKKRLVVLLCLAAPLLSFVFIRPEWGARLVADTTLIIIINILIFNYGLNPRSRILWSGGYAKVHKHSERRDRITEFVGRCLIVIFGLGFLYFITRTIAYDAFQVARQGPAYVLQIEGRVIKNDTLFGLYFVKQSLLVTKEGKLPGDSHQALLFSRIAHQGKTYSLVIAPKSGVILDFTEIPSGE